MTNLDEVTAALQSTRVSPAGVSFEGKGLKLDDAASAQVIVDAIANSKSLEFLNLEGNTLGVEAAKAITKALEKHPEFKRALWKDLFTGRLKTEIPQALKYLGDGLVTAGARLTELDLSDNAFGPIGVEGLAALLRSSTCFALEELKLNNNGLGITGGKLLASALLDCYNASKEQGHTLALKVFIAGRNRLENQGAKALARVFKTLGTLEEISMPQNGIYHPGISALSEAFAVNQNLQVLNLNDNIVGWQGATALAKAFSKLKKLRVLNFGDNLLKTKGALALADGLKDNPCLEELILGFNEIHKAGGIALAKSVANKEKLKNLVLDGNMFNEESRKEIADIIRNSGRYSANVPSLEECDSDEEEKEEENQDDKSDVSEDEEEEDDVKNESSQNNVTLLDDFKSFEEFSRLPTADNYIGLGNSRNQIILDKLKQSPDTYLENLIPTIMKVSALCVGDKDEVVRSAISCSNLLYKELFAWASRENNLSLVNNALLVNLGLIKSEDKKFKLSWKVEGCLALLERIIFESYVPESTKDTIRVFLGREIQSDSEDVRHQKKKIIDALLK